MLEVLRNLFALKQKPVDAQWVEQSKVFCMMPWVHFHVTQYGTVAPCCQGPWAEKDTFGNINRQSINEIWNSDGMRAFRQKMQRDQPDYRCERCYKKEAAGLYSLRKATNKDYLHHLQRVNQTGNNGYSEPQPVYFDIRFSNFCNFRCRICGPWSSSSWFNDGRAMGMGEGSLRLTRAIENEDSFFEEFKQYLPQVEEIYFAGGEPLLMDQHYRVLDLLIEMGLTHTYLRYNTNFSTFEYKGKSIFDYWRQFPNLFLCASLDDNYSRGELQRKGQDWNDVLAKRQQIMQQCPHIDFMLAPTVSLLNVFHLAEFHREWVEKGLIDVSEIFPSLLEEPPWYNIKALPAELKQRAEQQLRTHAAWIRAQPSKNESIKNLVADEFLKCVAFMWAEDLSSHLAALKEQTEILDRLRNEQLDVIVPEIKEVLR